jgi:hypothetical protein
MQESQVTDEYSTNYRDSFDRGQGTRRRGPLCRMWTVPCSILRRPGILCRVSRTSSIWCVHCRCALGRARVRQRPADLADRTAPADPGVLILSDRAGAACELTDALLVNPYETKGIARAIHTALTMSPAERRSRHQKLLLILRKYDIHRRYTRFVDELIKCTSKTSLVGRRRRSATGRDALQNSDIPPVRA